MKNTPHSQSPSLFSRLEAVNRKYRRFLLAPPTLPASSLGCAAARAMALFFRGPITSSPIKTRSKQDDQTCYSFDASFLSDSSYECFSTNPVTGSVCVCRRSPRLLSNGYYLLTEESVSTDDQGNLTLTPTQTNISYKENLVRIFRRKRKVRRSLASLLSDVSQSCQSWLDGHVFGRVASAHICEPPSWLDVSTSTEMDAPISFTYDPTETVLPPDKETFLPEEDSHPEVYSAHDMPTQSESGLLDVPPTSEYLYNSYSPPTYRPSVSDGVFLKAFLLLFFTLSICTAVFSRCLFGGVAVAVAFLFLISSICVSKSGKTVQWSQTKTEDITSRNE